MLLLIVLLLNTGLSLATEHKDFGTYIIACHTSDFECFKRQYKGFRDNVFLGNDKFVIDLFEPFLFKYGHSGTCIMLSGVHKSELVAISLNSITNEYMITLKMPLKIQQLKEVDENNVTRFCSQIDKNFRDTTPDNGKLNSFTGNVTVKVSYPCQIQRKKYSYLFLEEEDVDLILDIPDLSHFKDSLGEKGRLYQMSEWAYDVIQYIDVADLVLLPYTQRIRTAYERIPLEKFLLLYPEEQYSNVNFSFSDLKD